MCSRVMASESSSGNITFILNIKYHLKMEGEMTNTKNSPFMDVASCGLVDIYRPFKGTCHLHFWARMLFISTTVGTLSLIHSEWLSGVPTLILSENISP